MRINKFQVKNYSSFSNSGEISFGPGINFVVGQNNSGKSALLRSIFELAYNPHRSNEEFRTERLATPVQEFEIAFSGREVETVCLQTGGQFNWPIGGDPGGDGWERATRQIVDFFSLDDFKLSISRRPGQTPLIEGNSPYAEAALTAIFQITPAGPVFQAWTSNSPPSLPDRLDPLWRAKVFFFNAQRYNVGRCQVNMPAIMVSDATNLSAVLMRLQGDRGDVFRALTQHMRDIFSTVGNLSVTSPPNGTELEILVWPTIEQAHKELSTPLNDSGTGLSQVLAILTVAMTMEKSVIVIDEISSFLHPAAAKSLVRILEAHYPQHQYVISTHSPEVITACSPSTVHLVKKTGFTSSVTAIDVKDISDLRLVTGELGVTMTDVFASDRIVWVEGPTEELCFPYILEEMRASVGGTGSRQSLPQFTSVVATGDFTARRSRPELVFDIYDRLSRAAVTLAGAATFAFDSEELSQEQMNDLKRRGNERVKFLPRRMIECYLLSPTAIANVINAELGANSTSNVIIEADLKARGGGARYKAAAAWTGDIDDGAWLEKVDAAKLLTDLFDQISGSTLEFRKRKHSFEILKEMMAHDRSRLDGLIKFVEELSHLAAVSNRS